ncbi:MAG: Ig-like domain-containing protein, partial [Brevundimonas sp.]|nr:Ig-like domain-containing protein [Pseudomonadota bacterium]
VLDRARTASATFTPLPRHAIAVTSAGRGTGTIVSDPAGIDCPTSCTATFPSDAVVTLTATAATDGSVFTGFSGACTGTGPCQVSADDAREVIANFAAPSTTKLTLPAASRAYGVASTATVVVTGSSARVPSGTVRLVQGSTVVASGTLAGGKVVLTIPGSFAVGAHALVARFDGSGVLDPSSASANLTVNKAIPTVTAKLVAASVATPSVAKLTVTVAAAGLTPTGTVSVKDAGKVIATGTLVAGKVTITLPKTLAVGKHALVASFAGTTTVAAASSASQTLTVTKAKATVRATFAHKSVTAKAHGKVTVKVSATGLVPSGKVTVKDGTKVIATATLKGGSTTITLPLLKKGSHTLTFSYGGSATVLAATGKATLKVT